MTAAPDIRSDDVLTPVSPESWFHQMATDYVLCQILFHLNQVGVISLLAEGAALRSGEIARVLGLDAGATDALLDYVFEVDDLLERDDAGRYRFSEFGAAVVARYSRPRGPGQPDSINLFDVRVGAYGPVWQNVGALLRGARYGRDFHRDGRFADQGVFTLSTRFLAELSGHIDASGTAAAVEVGARTGLIELVGERYPGHRLYGLDRSREAIDGATLRAAAKGVDNICWIEADFFDPAHWTEAIDSTGRGVMFSLYFHELLGQGEDAFVAALRELRVRLPGWDVLAFEQPRLPHSAKGELGHSQWLYAQSNVLIHHLIGNGKILTEDGWRDLGRRAGCRLVSHRSCDYLGYETFAFRL